MEEQQYLDLLQHILDNGTEKGDRTGTGTISIFGHQMRFDLSKGFPLLTTKRVWLKGVIHELLWIISGNTNIKYLTDNNVNIWNEWADENGDLGPVYGQQWRSWFVDDNCDPIDQLTEVIEAIKNNPNSRRHIVTAWNPGVIDQMALPPCHCFFQFYVEEGLFSDGTWFDKGTKVELLENFDNQKGAPGPGSGLYRGYRNGSIDEEVCLHEEFKKGKLSCQLYQRSADVFLGVPFNIASYSLLTMMVAQVCDLEPGEFVHTFGDVHIYKNHLDQVKTQLERDPYPFPTMKINPEIKDIDSFKYEDFEIVDYKCHPTIKAPVAV